MTKFLQLFILTFSLLFCIYAHGNNLLVHSKHEIIADKLTEQIAKELTERYDLEAVGYGGSIHDDIEEMSISFFCYREMSLEEFRKLVVNCAEHFLKRVNSSDEIKPHLQNFPFGIKNIDLCVYAFAKDRTRLDIEQLAYVSVINGNVNFFKRKTEYTSKIMLKETYEEALLIVQDSEN